MSSALKLGTSPLNSQVLDKYIASVTLLELVHGVFGVFFSVSQFVCAQKYKRNTKYSTSMITDIVNKERKEDD